MIKKNLNHIISGVLALAIAGLYVLHFTGTDKANEDKTDASSVKTNIDKDASIAYLNIDTLLQEYDMYHEFRNQLEAKTRRLESDLTSRKNALERQVYDYQDKAQKGLLLRSQMQEIEQKLAKEQNDLMVLQQQMSIELAEEEQVLMRQILYSVMEYLKEYNADKGFEYKDQTELSVELQTEKVYLMINFEAKKAVLTSSKSITENFSTKILKYKDSREEIFQIIFEELGLTHKCSCNCGCKEHRKEVKSEVDLVEEKFDEFINNVKVVSNELIEDVTENVKGISKRFIKNVKETDPTEAKDDIKKSIQEAKEKLTIYGKVLKRKIDKLKK